MVLGMEVGLGPGHIVLHGDPAHPPPKKKEHKKGHSPQFLAHVYCDQTTGWIKIALGTEVGLGPGTLCKMGTQLPHPDKRGTVPNFRLMSIVAKRLDG